MGWKERNGRLYFYTSTRERGRVVTTYRGVGAFGVLVSEIEREDAAARVEARARARAAKSDAAALDAAVCGACRLLKLAADATMGDHGFHRLRRGRWRRARAMRNDGGTTGPLARKHDVGTLSLPEVAALSARLRADDPEAVGEWRRILAKAFAGDAKAIKDYMNLYRADREGLRIVLDAVVSLPVERLLARVYESGEKNNPATSEMLRGVMRDEVEQVALRLAGPSPSEVERLLAQRAALCWLDMQVTEIHGIGNMGYANEAIAIRRRDSSHHRFLSALKALASVRRVSLTAIQINVDRQG